MKNDYFVLDTHIHIGVSMGAQFIAEEDLIPYMDKYNINMAFVSSIPRGIHIKPLNGILILEMTILQKFNENSQTVLLD